MSLFCGRPCDWLFYKTWPDGEWMLLWTSNTAPAIDATKSERFFCCVVVDLPSILGPNSLSWVSAFSNARQSGHKTGEKYKIYLYWCMTYTVSKNLRVGTWNAWRESGRVSWCNTEKKKTKKPWRSRRRRRRREGKRWIERQGATNGAHSVYTCHPSPIASITHLVGVDLLRLISSSLLSL